MTHRVDALELLSGLTVVCHEVEWPKMNCRFTFIYGKRVVKDIYSYRKARAFAQGVSLGRQISITEWESSQ